MLKDITLGQYFPKNSAIHKMDPRFKIVLLIAYLVIIFIAENFISLGFLMLSVLSVIFISKIPFKAILKSLKPIFFIVIFTSIINIFFYVDGEVIAEFWIFRITYLGIETALFVALRIIILVAVSSLLTYTTTPTNLTDAIEKLLFPLKLCKVDVNSLAMMMTIALRFIPTLIDEVEKITNAQKARGADMESGGIKSKVKAVIPILIPLFISSFRRASELAFAMECRCYTGGENRTRMKKLRASYIDLIAVLFVAVIICGVIILNSYAGFARI